MRPAASSEGTPTGARLLRHRSNAVYLLPRKGVVARLAPDTPLRRRRAGTIVAVTRWPATPFHEALASAERASEAKVTIFKRPWSRPSPATPASRRPHLCRHGVGQLDMSARLISIFEKFGLAHDVRRPTPRRLARLAARG